jgi:hypothetical protein
MFGKTFQVPWKTFVAEYFPTRAIITPKCFAALSTQIVFGQGGRHLKTTVLLSSVDCSFSSKRNNKISNLEQMQENRINHDRSGLLRPEGVLANNL